MTGLVLPTVRVAAVQAAPVFLDLAATLDKVDALVAEAANNVKWLAALTLADRRPEHLFTTRLYQRAEPGADGPGDYRIAARATDGRGRVQPQAGARNEVHAVSLRVRDK